MDKITECTVDEVLVKCLAQTIEDYTILFHRVYSPCPSVAIPFAKKTHAPHICYISGVGGGVNPDQPFLPLSSNDVAMSQGATVTIPVGKVFDICSKGELDRMFLSGSQIDRYGNANVSLIGDIGNIKIKFPGGAGGCNMSCGAKRVTLWTTRHRAWKTSKGKNFTFVDKLDFLTNVGHITPSGTRKELNLVGGGPDWVVTNLGVFDFEDKSKMMRLRYLFPDVPVEEILENTEFRPLIAEDVTSVELPTSEEVALMRSIDPLGVRKREFPLGELKRVYRI